MKDKYNIVEFFSGIGSQARALKNIGIECNVQHTCEWDIHAFMAYDVIQKGDIVVSQKYASLGKKEAVDVLSKYTLSNNGKTAMLPNTLSSYPLDLLRRIISSIDRSHNLVDINSVSAEDMYNDTDILTYSFPCQDLSNVGAFHGYNSGIDKDSGSRSSLLWQVGRILTEMKEARMVLPRYLIMENVPTLLSPRHKSNFDAWVEELNGLGYVSKYLPVNAKDYGIPQNRPRLLMMSVYVENDIERSNKVNAYFNSLGTNQNKIVEDYKNSKFYQNLTLECLLRCDYSNEKYKKEAIDCTPNDTPSRRRIWSENPKLVLENNVLADEKYVRTLTTKQDRNPNSGNLFFDSGIVGRSKFRYLTPRECMLFMGFTDGDYEALISNNPETRKHSVLFPRDKIIRLAGNSIPVKMLEGFLYQLYTTEKIIFDL